MDLSVLSQLDAAVGQSGVDRTAFLPSGEDPERSSPAKLGGPLPRRDRRLDVISVDCVFAREVPDLQSQRVATDTRLDRPIETDATPQATDAFLSRLPFLERLQVMHAAPDSNAPRIPAVEPTRKRQLVEGVVEACLVVDLIGREVRHDVLDAPPLAVTGGGPLLLFEAMEKVTQAANFAVVGRKRIGPERVKWGPGSQTCWILT